MLLVATRDVDFACPLADRVTVLAHGLTVQDGAVVEVLVRPNRPATSNDVGRRAVHVR